MSVDDVEGITITINTVIAFTIHELNINTYIFTHSNLSHGCVYEKQNYRKLLCHRNIIMSKITNEYREHYYNYPLCFS